MTSETRQLSEWERDVLSTVASLPGYKTWDWTTGQSGSLEWVTSATVREKLQANSLATRQTLKRLAAGGYLKTDIYSGSEVYYLSPLGIAAIHGDGGPEIIVKSDSWTGVVQPVQIIQVLHIVSEIEDICESMTDNESRSQILGLVRALQVLLDLPNPPRQGIVALARDPAFSSFIQVAGCLAAIIAAIKA